VSVDGGAPIESIRMKVLSVRLMACIAREVSHTSRGSIGHAR